MVDVWNQFYGSFEDADFPVLVVRFEDTLFYLPEIIEAIQVCLGACGHEHMSCKKITRQRGKGPSR